MKTYNMTMTQSGHAMPIHEPLCSLEKRIVRAQLDKVQQAAAILASFGWNVDQINNCVRDINMELVG